jgi:DNA polymerase-3 subunit gamma/tau
MSYEPLHHKYRPQTFADLVGQEAIATTLTNAIRASKIAPAYLLTGPRGTGKTSSARILAKSLNCLSSKVPTEKPCGVCEVCKAIANGSALDVIEIDAASNTGVENIRDLIERAQFAPVQCRFKVYIIDEVHMLSQAAFNALLKILEEPPERVVFVLATTDPQRVLPTIISRCQRFDFRRIAIDAMVKHLREIASQENINIAPEAVQLVAQVAQGGLRDAESLLDQLSLLSGQVTVERVWDLVGSCSEPDLIELLQAIAQNNPEAVLDRARTIMDRGREPLTVLQNLASFYRDLLIAKTAPSRNDLVIVTPPTWKALCELALLWDISIILAGQQHLAKSEIQIKNTTQPRLWLEVTLLGLLPAANLHQVATGVPVAPRVLPGVNVQPMVSPPEKGIQRQTVDAFTSNITKQQQHITSDGISQAQQTPPDQAASAAESSQPPVQRENPQPTTDLGYHPDLTSPPIPEPAAEVEPSASTSQPLMSANSASDTPREQVWQQVLANLQPISTQALLRQMGHLIEFDGTVARIGMKSQALCDKAKTYRPNIRAAFQETFQCEVEVRLELAIPNQTKTASVKEPRGQSPLPQAMRTATGTAPATSPQVVEPGVSDRTATSSPQAQTLTQFQSRSTAGGSTAPKVSELPKLGEAKYTPTNAASWEEDEVTIAAQRLADFFKGEVVDAPALPQSVATNTLTPPIASECYDGDVSDGEADVEF